MIITESKVLLRDAAIGIVRKYLSRNTLLSAGGKLLILRLDSIGDYILFRNFLKPIRESERFRDFKITLCGNIAWKDIAVFADSAYVDEFIWIDTSRFLKRSHWSYTYGRLLELHSVGFDVLLEPSDVKTKSSEFLKRHSGAKKFIENSPVALGSYREKIIERMNRPNSRTNGSHNSEFRLRDHFQFYLNRDFTEELTGTSTGIDRPFYEIDSSGGRSEYIVLFPGAGYQNRIWSAENFATLCRQIRRNSRIGFFICGSSNDTEIAQKIIELSGVDKIEDLTGKTSLPQLFNLIARSSLLISNETCAVHIAASVNAKTICISNGNHFGRFNPYPAELSPQIVTVYPPAISNRLHDHKELMLEYAVSSDLDINEISAADVCSEALKLL
ncbi:MAG: hypothetical protein K1X85_14400 [Ignavibacteria bacterium]|nr:hypothetical protein [Ignavibacteria bacterium]